MIGSAPGSLAIVIPTFDSSQTLPACLGSIQRQTTQPDEVIVVDDVRTVDATREIARRYGARLVISPALMAASRNEGIRLSNADYLLSIDSDMVLPLDLVGLLHSAFARGADACSVREIVTGSGYWLRGRILDKLAVEETGVGRAIRAFTRQVFDAVGGFDSELEAGEDLDFHLRALAIRANVIHLDGVAIVHQERHLTLAYAFVKKYRYGRTWPAFEAKHGHSLTSGFARRLLSGLRIGLQRDPLALPGLILLKFVEGLGGYAGRMISGRVHLNLLGPERRLH